MKSNHRAILAMLCLGNSHAWAAGDPADAAAPVPPATYQSPFGQYRVLGEDRNTPWKEANDTVRAIGGWRAYARESAEAAKARAAIPASPAPMATPAPAPSPAATPTPTTPPATPPAGQHKHGG